MPVLSFQEKIRFGEFALHTAYGLMAKDCPFAAADYCASALLWLKRTDDPDLVDELSSLRMTAEARQQAKRS